MAKERNKQIKAIEDGVDAVAKTIRGRRTDTSMRNGGEDDISIPADKRRDSYGKSIINRPGPRMTAEDHKGFADALDYDPKGKGSYLDPGFRDAARMHQRSLEGHARADAISKKQIEEARRQGKK